MPPKYVYIWGLEKRLARSYHYYQNNEGDIHVFMCVHVYAYTCICILYENMYVYIFLYECINVHIYTYVYLNIYMGFRETISQILSLLPKQRR
jgi:hypothetical protein